MEFFALSGEESKNLAVVNRLGAPSRQGEEAAVAATLASLAETHPSLQIARITSGTLDGGDVLYTPSAVFVGKSHRTTKEAIENLRALLSPLDLPVFSIVVEFGLHLKSCCSLIDHDVIAISDDEAGRSVRAQLEKLPFQFQFLVVPEHCPSNVLRIGNSVIIQEGFPKSESVLRSYADSRNLQVHTVKMSEFIKADGALTCCSVLLNI